MPRHRWWQGLFVFLAFAIVRGLAESLSGGLPVGWDSLNYYAPWTVAFMNRGIVNQYFLSQQPHVFAITILITMLTQNVWITIKIIGPLLYGLLGFSVFWFTSSYLSWTAKKSAICSLLLMCQTGALRISWDLFKNQLAIALMFFQLLLVSYAVKRRETKLTATIVALSMLLVLTHEYVAVLYFVILVSVILSRKKESSFKKYLLLTNVPALVLFFLIFGIYSAGTGGSLVSYPGVDTLHFFKTIHYVDFPTFSVFKDYLSLYGSYSTLFTNTITLFTLLYAGILPLAFLGFWNDDFLTPFLVFSLIGTFLPLVSPTVALLDFERWMFMLVYPLSIYSANAIFIFVEFSCNKRQSCAKSKRFKLPYVSKREIAVSFYILFLIAFALSYVVGNARLIYKPIETYVPTSLSDKPISNEAFQNIVQDIDWLNNFYTRNSTINLLDEFNYFNSDLWNQIGEGYFNCKDSILTLNTLRDSDAEFLHLDFGANYAGIIELRIRFNGFEPSSHLLDLFSIRKLGGGGQGVIYCYNSSNEITLNYWSSETATSYQIASLDQNWHTLAVTCDYQGRTINLDGTNKLNIVTERYFGEISIGRENNSTLYGGSFSIDYLSVKASLSACLVSSFRETGPLWIYLVEKIEIIIFSNDLQKALDFAESRNCTSVFVVLPTATYQGLTAVHESPTYSVYV